MAILKRNVEWLKSNCPFCGKEYEYTATYKPATCGKFSCLQEANKRGKLRRQRRKEMNCAKCRKTLTRETAWTSDDRQDRNLYCYDCASDDALRVKDLLTELREIKDARAAKKQLTERGYYPTTEANTYFCSHQYDK